MTSKEPAIVSQQLGVVARLFPDIMSGAKTSTIRWNEGPIAPGLMRYVCDEAPHTSMVVLVTSCTTMPLSKAATFLGRETDWPPPVMLEGMREHYPDIELSDVVVVIEHLPPS